MNKTKSFTQYSESNFNISIRIKSDGKIRERSRITIRDKKDKILKYLKIWRKNNKNKMELQQRKWRNLNKDKCRLSVKKQKYKRKGWGVPTPINEWFDGSHLHHLHINNTQESIYIPEKLHKSIHHSNINKESMNKINKIAIDWYNLNK